MQRRKLIIGDYDTALRGPWTLAAWAFPEPDHQTNLVEVPGRDGPLDLSAVLTEGVPVYGSRELTATLECSEGTYEERTVLIREMVNMLDGRRLKIILPDLPTHYAEGRVSIKTEFNNLAHCAVSVKAICDPWRYNNTETVVKLYGDDSGVYTAVLPNSGRKTIVPTVTAEGCTELFGTKFWVGEKEWRITADGVYVLPELKLPPGNTIVEQSKYDGRSTTFTYREAVL